MSAGNLIKNIDYFSNYSLNIFMTNILESIK